MKFICPFCRTLLSVDDSDLGIDVQCGQCGEISKSPLSHISTNVVIGNDYIVLEELGRGGMGIVYLTHQISLDRPAALKVLAKKYADNSEFIAGFIKEARAAAKLNHPNIVQAYAVGEDSGIYYFAMEYIEGETMKDVLKKFGVIPIEQASEIIRQIADALDFAWKEQRLIHRDIKPDNIMIVSKNQRAKLADLGLARVAGEIDDSKDDEVMGTPQYISPEALTGAPMDVRSDIYSLGATFYHLLTGVFPFTGRNALEIAKKHLQEPLKNPRLLNSSIPDSVADIVIKMMNKSPDDRYQTPESLVEDLRISKKGGKVSAGASGGRKTSIVFHTSQIKGIGSSTGTSTQGITTKSSNVNIGSHTSSARINTGAMRKEREEKARTQFIAMIVICVMVIASVTFFMIWKNSKKTPPPPPTIVPVQPNNTNVVIPKIPEPKEPENTEYTEAVAKILDFIKNKPEARSDILAKCDNFFSSRKPTNYKCDQDAMLALLALYIPLDEKYRLADARQRERESHMVVIQKILDEEKRQKLKEDEKLKILRKEEELARLKKQREEESKRKNDKYIVSIGAKKDALRYSVITQTMQKNNYSAAILLLDETKKEPDLVEVEFKETAREFVRWAEKNKELLEKTKIFFESLANRNEAAIKINIEIRPGAFGKVQKIKGGEVFIQTSSGKIERNHLMKIPVSQYKKLVSKFNSDTNILYLAMLFSGNFEELEQLEVEKDVKEEGNKFVSAYITGKYNEINNLVGADKEKALNEFKAKYSKLPQYKEALGGTLK